MTAEASTGISEGRVGRYILDDLIAESPRSQLWRASDPALNRPVGARLIPLTDPVVPRIREAARAAARVDDRRIVQVLDVVETRQHLAVISEWVEGRPWSEVLLEAEEANEAVIVACELARALQTAHSMGVTHGRIRPSSVMITETHEVRLRGLGVDAALYGVEPGEDARLADLHSIGAMLYVGLTGRWPDPHLESRPGPKRTTLDGLPVIGPVGGWLPAPGELLAGVPPELNDIAVGCLQASTSKRSRSRKRIPDVDAAVSALSRALDRSVAASPVPAATVDLGTTGADRAFRRLASVVVVGITAAAGVLFVGSLLQGENPSYSAEPQPPAASPSPRTDIGPVPLPIAAISDFDPQGGDGTENPDLVPFATDGDAGTAWRTVNYKNSSMAPKTGTGLLIDLGLTRPISAVSLQFEGTGTDVELRIADRPGTSAEDFELLAGAVAVGEEIVLRTPIPVPTRYILVWLTDLPYNGSTYRGGIHEVQVLG